MKRRAFVAVTGGAFLGTVVEVGSSIETIREGQNRFHLRYAPRLDFLSAEWTIPQRLEKFAANGFDATEYNGLMKHSLKEVESIRKKLDFLGMQMGIFVANPGAWKTAGLCASEHRENFLDELRHAVEYHRIIGNEFCTVVTGLEQLDVTRSEQRKNVIEGLKRAADILESTGLTIVVEPLNDLVDHAGYFLVRSDEAAEIMDAVGSPRVKILFDIYHQQISEGNLIHNIREYKNFIGYFQVGDVPGRNEPGTGEINWKNVFKAIYETGFRGILGMEHGLSNPGEAGLMKCFNEYRKADSWEAV